MELSAVQYIADQQGHAIGVIVPIHLWKDIQERLEAEPVHPDVSAWDVLDSLAGSIDAPPDWSAEHDHYLYGTPKQG